MRNLDSTAATMPMFLSETRPFIEDYALLLDDFGVPYKAVAHQYQVGEISRVQGWLLHISVVRSQALDLFSVVLPSLLSAKIVFRIVQNPDVLRSLLDGGFGQSQVGKVLTIYPDSDDTALSLATSLIALSQHFRGPVIPTDLHLGGNVYTRFGAINPIIRLDGAGRAQSWIYSPEGQLIPDEYHIPFQTPIGISIPFPVTAPLSKKSKHIENPKYKLTTPLKIDAKGDVYKALYIKKPFFIKSCVIKEGKKDMWSDAKLRAMPDRLRWQEKVHQQLGKLIPVPKIIDYFESNGDAYLVMDYIQGKALYDVVHEINPDSIIWHRLPLTQRAIIVDICLQAIRIIQIMHRNGYIHRDVTPLNFLVTKKSKLIPIDNELTFSTTLGEPLPPFEAGTHGFMSPQQIQVQYPSFADDVYGLGSTLIAILTGISPILLCNTDPLDLIKDIFFFLQDDALSNLLSACLEHAPQLRPQLKQLDDAFVAYSKITQPVNAGKEALQFENYKPEVIKQFIQAGLHGLAAPHTLFDKPLWYSVSRNQTDTKQQNSVFQKSIGLYEGFTGVLYLLSKASMAGFDVTHSETAFNHSIAYLFKHVFPELQNLTSGLYGGTAGIGLTLVKAIEGNLLENTLYNQEIIRQCLVLPTEYLDLANGAAGKIVALLRVRKFLPSEFFDEAVQTSIQLIQSKQSPDHTWIKMQTNRRKNLTALSFSHGDTGILWSLLEYLSVISDNSLLSAITPSMDLCCKHALQMANAFRRKSVRTLLEDAVIGNDFKGLVYVLLKSYTNTQNQRYLRAAEDLLALLPAFPSHENIFQANGLAGIGELYLEAESVSASGRWFNQAMFIASYLTTVACKPRDGTIYWLGSGAQFPTADLMVGTSGVLHFLMRCLAPDEIKNCLIS